MVEDFYTELSVYADIETDWDNPPDDNGDLTFVATFQGFIQTRGGSNPFSNQARTPKSSHLLYTGVDSPVVVGDYIKFLDNYYHVEFVPPLNGISGIEDHLEIAVNFQRDIN